MESENKIHFGLTFPADFPLDENSRHQLAKILLLNPRISIPKVKDILNINDLWEKVGLLTDKLHCQLTDISFPKSEANEVGSENQFSSIHLELLYELFQLTHPKEDIEFNNLRQKLFLWTIEFSFPLPHELEVIASAIKVPDETVSDTVYTMLFHKNMPAKKLLDYLGKYLKLLSTDKVDRLLDLYSTKTIKKHNVTYVQLDMFADNNLETH